jgi:hypothetical protein
MPELMPENKPVAEACLRNQAPIADTLAKIFVNPMRVLELGSGTGQHAVAIANKIPHISWQPTDLAACLPGINAWRADAGLSNVLEPVALDVCHSQWPVCGPYDGIFTANTVHFVSWSAVRSMLAGVSRQLDSGGIFCVYGPFNVNGEYTSEGNQRLDLWLKTRDPESGIKDLQMVTDQAAAEDLVFEEMIAMPANNLMLKFVKADP